MNINRTLYILGLDIVDQDYLVTPEGREEWETYKKYSSAVSSLFRYDYIFYRLMRNIIEFSP